MIEEGLDAAFDVIAAVDAGVLQSEKQKRKEEWSDGVLEWWGKEPVVRALSALSAVLLLLVAAPAVHAEKLRISYASVTGNTAVITYVAQRAGLFEKYGLGVEIILITGGPAAVSALLNGDVDLDLRAPIAAVQAMAHGARLTFLLSQSNTL